MMITKIFDREKRQRKKGGTVTVKGLMFFFFFRFFFTLFNVLYFQENICNGFVTAVFMNE